MERDLIYEEKNSVYDFDNLELKYIKCKNYELCGEMFPIEWVKLKIKWGTLQHYLCVDCRMIFGNWMNKAESFIEKGVLKFCDSDRECPICLDVKPSIFQPRCKHTLCIDCFKRCYYGDKLDKPEFPYPDVEDEYYMTVLNAKWNIDYPLIKNYLEDYDKWEDKRYENESQLRKCCLCRK